MRIITLNANGIRSAARKGFFDWLQAQDADVVCVQETKCQRDQLSDPMFCPAGYHCYYFDAVKKGYSGVAVYSRVKPDNVVTGYGSSEFDTEGRYIEAQFKNLSVVSVYLPSGSSSEDRQQAKFRCLGEFMPYLRSLKRRRRDLHPVRRLEHRAQADRPAQLEIEPEEFRIPARGTRVARRAFRRRAVRRCVPRSESRTPTITRGGRTAARRGTRTSAGASTTRC